MPAPPPPRCHRRTATAIVGVLALAAVTTGCGSSDSAGSATEATAEDRLPPTVTIEADGDPTAGGELAYGIEAESEGWNPTKTRWATSGTLVGASIFDTLAAFDDTGRVVPYLAEEITPNGNFTEWTVVLRDGVTFHDGQPLTSEAVKLVLDQHVGSPLTGPIVEPIDRVDTPDARTAVVVMKEPWSAFPAVLTGQIGMVPAPSQLNDPTDGTVTRPVGTGPFVFDSWIRDSELVVERNEDYWREGLPYLDSVTFTPLPDPAERLNALEAGTIDVAHVRDPATVAEARELAAARDAQVILDPTEPEELFLMLNSGRAPFDDLDARRAVAFAVEVDRYNGAFGEDIAEPATGPYPETSQWFADSEWPEADPAKARELVTAYEEEHGPMAVTFLATKTPDDIASAGLLEAMLEEVGIDVETRFLEQGDLFLQASAGTYDVALWRQWSAPDPDGEYLWWHSSTSQPVGQLSINVGRLEDPEIDEALDTGRGTLDETTRIEAYAELQMRLTEQVPYVWINHVPWTIVADTDVRDLPNGPLPDGQASLPFGGPASGSHRLTQVWIDS